MKPTENTSKPRLICFYVRNSTQQQEYQYQIDNLTNWLNRFNDVKLVKIFAEKISGFKNERERPEMNRLLEFIKTGGVNEIWVNDFARLSRDAVNLQIIVKECADSNVNIYFHSNNLYSLDSIGEQNLTTRLIISNLALFAEMDAKNFKTKGIQGKVSKSKSGSYVGGTLPCGYTYNEGTKDKKITVDPAKKKVVEYCFDCVANKKMTLNSIANSLNNLKNIDSDFDTVMRSKGYGKQSDKWLYNSWTGSQVQSIIKCTWYSLGFRVFNGEKFNIDPELVFIDLDLYNRANEQMQSNQFVKSKTKYPYIMKELIFCECGDKMYPQNSGIRQTYHCNKNKQHDVDKNVKCKIGKAVEIERLENIIWCLIKNKLPEFKLTIENKANKEQSIKEQIQQNISLISSIINVQLPQLEEQKQRALNLAIKFNVDVTEQMNQIEYELKSQNEQIAILSSENNKLQLSISEINLSDELQNQLDIIEADKKLVNYYTTKLIKKISIMGGLYKQLYNVIRVEWSDIVDIQNDTFVFYRSKQKLDNLYYYITGYENDIKIEWNNDSRQFAIRNEYYNTVTYISPVILMYDLKKYFTTESDSNNNAMYDGTIELDEYDSLHFNAGQVQELFKLK
jgi:DNA invertase Pin-like site-specific DNA recombinase